MILIYAMNLGMLGGPVTPPTTAANFPDPFAAAVVARVDPLAASVANKGS